MRLTMLAIPALVLGACTTPPQTSVAAIGSTEPAIEPHFSFDVPMDPGQIRCSSLSNSVALEAAVQWTIGQARAGVLAGRDAEIPGEGDLAQIFAAYCAQNPNNTVRAAAIHWGLAS
ncbi:hypothetical protein [Octadecabacter ascidiaceicola]|uniref:Lipoprotein n=1 Tax=Octadecabacter ascidiaceicola TaxID=1655543 RepID=A0A238K546_9RHOB|nr:hypothetical protein [Octadecabacter ascidiaceicola]SMX38031.1 hypothetical protein OCA8868_01648 [Octadecabacter ascidiaceicola]